MLPTKWVECPYCGEPIELVIDDSVGDQQYIEDCPVCCRPINVDVSIGSGDEIRVLCRAEGETWGR